MAGLALFYPIACASKRISAIHTVPPPGFVYNTTGTKNGGYALNGRSTLHQTEDTPG